MKSIKVYSAEALDGLGDKIQSNNSLAYTSSVESCGKEHVDKVLSAVAQKNHNIETLYAVKSLLVTTNWNKNDDVFSPSATWAARHTPINTQTNIGHNHDQIVGHITSTWVVGNDGEVIDDETDEIPEHFHICDGSVIYKHWGNEELQERIDNLIEQIDAGEMYVSMECLFPGFDYAIISPDKDEYYTIARNEETAFLTKHLRSYGGEGTFQGYKIGRLLKGMVFSGKGYVDVPANPNSIIFDDSSELTEFAFSKAKEENPFDTSVGIVAGLNNTDMEKNMSENVYKEQLEEAKAFVSKLQKENKELETQVSEANVSSLKELIATQEADNATLTSEREALDVTVEQNSAKMTELESKITELSDAKEKIEAELETVKTEKLFANRVSILVAGGLSKEDASEKVSKFENLNDEQFEEISVAILAGVSKVTEEDAEEEATKTDATDTADASDEVLENAEVTDTADALGSVDTDDTEQQDKVRQSMAKIFSDETEEETVS